MTRTDYAQGQPVFTVALLCSQFWVISTYCGIQDDLRTRTE